MLKYFSIFLIAVLLFFGFSNSNSDYANCMKATKHDYISKKGAEHIAAQCEAFIKKEVMLK